ncbi:MAG: hypothetical protein KBE23_19825 [Chloroflexi bacterium]|nr:hypothetical protein [Chloroflexota bacterium]
MLSTGLGSASAIVTGSGQKVNETRYLPFGGYRSGGPSTITDRGFTGHKENMTDLGLIYMNARFYAPGLGRFLSADSIVPNPINPQSLNRYSYVRNSPLNLIDPTGHRECGYDCSKPITSKPSPSLPKLSSKITPKPILEGLPIQDTAWVNGFGANSFTQKFADPNSPDYNGVYSGDSAGIHPGMDFGKNYDPNCPECMIVHSNVSGIVKVGIFDGDAEPNVVVEVDLGNGTKIYVIYGHVMRTVIDGTKVNPGDPIGTLQDQREYKTNADGSLQVDATGNPLLKRDNTHVHLAIRQDQRIFNPAYFWKDSSEISALGWSYPSWGNLYNISSYEYTPGRSYWNNPGTAFGMTRN